MVGVFIMHLCSFWMDGEAGSWFSDENDEWYEAGI